MRHFLYIFVLGTIGLFLWQEEKQLCELGAVYALLS